MYTLRKRNVNGLFRKGLCVLAQHGDHMNSRAGKVVVAPWPVMSIYERPCERVLLDPVRNANPFFHLYEGLWMLAGRRDAASLNRYVSDFGERFGEADGTIHDAYGHRWRNSLGYDQLDVVIGKLRTNPDDRQAVIQMWDATETIEDAHQSEPGNNDLLGAWKGRPCNTHIYLRVRTEAVPEQFASAGMGPFQVLDMTILCRSNDVVWGAYGANAVHFSMLMEYLAGRIGVGVGLMYQFSNNWHGYVDALNKIGDPENLEQVDPYATGDVSAMPMGTHWSEWDADLGYFMAWHNGGSVNLRTGINPPYLPFTNSWFPNVAVPMLRAHAAFKDGNTSDALMIIDLVQAEDWHQAGRAWLLRQRDRQKRRNDVGEVRAS
jgi:thymidylate synthase